MGESKDTIQKTPGTNKKSRLVLYFLLSEGLDHCCSTSITQLPISIPISRSRSILPEYYESSYLQQVLAACNTQYCCTAIRIRQELKSKKIKNGQARLNRHRTLYPCTIQYLSGNNLKTLQYGVITTLHIMFRPKRGVGNGRTQLLQKKNVLCVLNCCATTPHWERYYCNTSSTIAVFRAVGTPTA